MRAGTATERAGTATERAKIRTIETQTAPPDTANLHTQTEERAYQLYEERGSDPGHEMEDWLEAEQEILGRQIDTDLG